MSQRGVGAGGPPSPEELTSERDEALVAMVRDGQTQAYAVLYQRYYDDAVRVALRFQPLADAQDMVQEAFLRVLRAIQEGGGPRDGFGGYLARAVRNLQTDRSRRTQELPTDDIELASHPQDTVVADGVDALLERGIVTRAFRTLPDRWQQILWLTEVEGGTPQSLADQLGMQPTAIAALAMRARGGLRTAWLQAHVSTVDNRESCRPVAALLGDYERGKLPPRKVQLVEVHLEQCDGCSAALAELGMVSHRLGGVLLPLVLASPDLLARFGSGSGAVGLPASPDAAHHALDGAGASRRAARAGGGGAVGVAMAAMAVGQGRRAAAYVLLACASLGAVSLTIAFAVAQGSDGSTPVTPSVERQLAADPLPQPGGDGPAAKPKRPHPADDPLPVEEAVDVSVASAVTQPTARAQPTTEPEPEPTTAAAAPTPPPTSEPAPTRPPAPVPTVPVATMPVPPVPVPTVPVPVPVPVPAVPVIVKAPSPGDVLVAPQLTGTADPAGTVDIIDAAGAVVGTTTVGEDGAWTFTPPLPAGNTTQGYRAVAVGEDGVRSKPSATTAGPYTYLAPTIECPGDLDGCLSDSDRTEFRVITEATDYALQTSIDGGSTWHQHAQHDRTEWPFFAPVVEGEEYTYAARYVDPVTGATGAIESVTFTFTPS